MKMDWNPKRTWITGGVSLAVIAGAAWGWSAYTGADGDAVRVPKDLTLAALQEKAKEPEKLMDTLGDAYRRDDLTEEQRRQVRNNMRTVFETQMDLRMSEYFSASEGSKREILDRHIDEFQERMKQWQERRAQQDRDGDSEANRDRRGGDGQGRRGGRASRSQSERKARSESRDADQSARRIAYFTAMRQRMAARGIQSLWRGRGARDGSRGGSSRTR